MDALAIQVAPCWGAAGLKWDHFDVIAHVHHEAYRN